MAERIFVVVGGGLAGAKAVESLRTEGFDGQVVLVAAEDEYPYDRPPLSKEILKGTKEAEAARVHPPHWYADEQVDLRMGTRATALDPAGRRVQLDGGEWLGYDAILLATGSQPRRLTLDGAADLPLHYLRTLADATRLRADLAGGRRRVLVVGAGWIGLEVAAAAKEHGNDVTVLEPQPTPLFCVLGPELGEVFAGVHRRHEVDLRTGTGVARLGRSGDAILVTDAAGIGYEADVVVVGVGARPDTALAEAAGLTVDDGIVVDAALRASAAGVFAAGDVARAYNPLLQRHVRVEHWANALHSGPAAARSMLGQEVSFERVPYFYTDQFNLGMEYSGYVAPGQQARVVHRGDPQSMEFISFWLDADDRVLAGMNVNVWDVVADIQGLVRAGRPVDVQRLSDPGVPLPEALQ